MSRRPLAAVLGLALALSTAGPLPVRADDPAPPASAPSSSGPQTAADVEACMKSNQPTDSAIQSIEMVSTDRVGNATRMQTKMYWQKEDGRSKVLMHFTDPPDLRGSSLLMLEQEGRNDMFMYLPELRKTRRVTSHMMNGSMFGTDFTYEEFERLQGLADDLSSERLPDAEIDGRAVYVVAQTPDPEGGSEYERVVVSVDAETCVPLQTEFFKKGDRLVKRATSPFASVTKEGSGWIPRRMAMANLVEGTETTIEVTEIEVGARIPKAYFSQSRLDRIGH